MVSLPKTLYVTKSAVLRLVCLIAEIAAWAKEQWQNIVSIASGHIYVEYGFSKEKGISVVKKGKSGALKIDEMMTNFRNNPPKEMAGQRLCYGKTPKFEAD